MKFWASLVIGPWGKFHFLHFPWGNYNIKFQNFVKFSFLSAFKYCLAKYLKSHLSDPISNTILKIYAVL